ncbi:MAG TPA: hypothetical protein VFN87_11070 [Solirubrobacteraceae bacterium]|nr:hypothetical protein [Solirubrobacteraceae bacterium]
MTPARRDAGLRRLHVLNRVLIGGAVVVTGLLTDVAANAFPGHKRTVGSSSVSQPGAARTSGSHRRHHRTHHRSAHTGLSAPAQAPSATTGTGTAPAATAPAQTATAPAQTAPAQTATAPAQTVPAPAPAPSPVISGGS